MPASRPPTHCRAGAGNGAHGAAHARAQATFICRRRARCRSCRLHAPAFAAEPEPRVLTGTAEQAGLTEGTASLVVAEATLTLNAPAHKQAIAAEAFRILRPGGRYAIHGLAIVPDGVADGVKIETTLSRSIHVGAGAVG
ncbi:class I SAM-dependent methyltransferase [Devosia sp. 67-54]|uniref:class I SAM-dependent methyltransferase n=1 Tax=unclassified Devosia TaxID=196773 RepID=UPI001ACF3546|nr:methyltransferase domain-containing protein [Devosia sp.]